MRYYFFSQKNNGRSVAVFFILVGLLSVFLGALSLCVPTMAEGELYDKVIRLHVVANSDSDEDQELKLALRDAVIECYTELFERSQNRDMAYSILSSQVDDINEFAQNFISKRGYSYSCRTVIGEEYYNRTQYQAFTMPAGKYASLRIIIGEGEGKNWWCVLFPPLCTKAAMNTVPAEEMEDSFIEAGFTGEQYRIITESEKPRYRIRFRLLELLFG